MRTEKSFQKPINGDAELDILLGEIPRAASSLNLHSTSLSHGHHHDHQHHQKSTNIMDHVHASPSSSSRGMPSGYGHHHVRGSVDGMYDHKYASPLLPSPPSPSSFPMSGFSWPSDCSATSLPSANGKALVDDFDLAADFSKMYVGHRQEAASSSSPNHIGSSDQYVDRVFRINLGKDEIAHYTNKSVPKEHVTFGREIGSAFNGIQHDPRFPSLYCSYGNSGFKPQFQSPALGDGLSYGYQNRMNLIKIRDGFCWPHMAPTRPYYNGEKSLNFQLPNGRLGVPQYAKMPQQSVDSFAVEDSLIIGGNMINHGINKGHTRLMGQNRKNLYQGADKIQEKNRHIVERVNMSSTRESCKSPRKFSSPSYFSSKHISLEDARGRIYQLAKDQQHCKNLQMMLDEGKEVNLIFNEIIDHVAELMTNPFGNYLVQKLLDVCHEEQRLHILHRVIHEPGQLLNISSNTHGTRVVQKLIETLTSKMQIELVVSALEPGFLQLIKDSNGNHVVQKCLQIFSPEDSEFIFVAAANYCVEIATHQYGCVVLQRCIIHSTGELKENLVAVISENGLLLAHDAFGNYVVQFLLDLKHPLATSKMTSLFRGNYVDLSMLKHSSHVVEKCLHVCDDEVKSNIIDELLSCSFFEQLLQDPHANYVIQRALEVEGTLHNDLVDKIESYGENVRNSPCSKRIFSSKFLKKW